MKVVVRSYVSECQFEAVPKTPLREVFDLMCKNLLIFEKWYFGVHYKDEHDVVIWIDASKKTLKHLTKSQVENLLFRVKHYPEEVEEELLEKSTVELFFNEIKTNIYNDAIFCPADTCVILAAYALQAKFGDFTATNEPPIEKQKLIPERILKQHSLDASEWQQNVCNMWKKLQGLEQEDAMMEYLKLAQNLEMYGVTYFEITNRKGTELYLGINALGLDVYKREDKLNPMISFPWSEIRHLKFKDRKFVIKATDRSIQDFIVFTDNAAASKRVLKLGIGNHMLYVKRRKPESQEMTAMKAKSRNQKVRRLEQKNKISREIAAREEVERRERDYKETIETMRKEMEEKQARLLEAQETIRRLQEQLLELQQAKEELEKQQHELREMMERLEHAKNMEAAEKEALEEEIRRKQSEVLRIQREVDAKDEEAKRLQEQVEEAQRLAEERRAEEERRRLREEEEERERGMELEQLENADNTLPEIADINEKLRDEVKLLQDQLNRSRDEEMATDLDKIHRVNLLQGRNKYKTLADIRKGNTSRRVELFECL